jgi:hypothetical protein
LKELNKEELKIVFGDIMDDTIESISYWGLCCSPSVHGFFITYNNLSSLVRYYTKEDIKLIKRKVFLNGVK